MLLPLELLHIVISFLDAPDLATLARTSLALQDVSESILYQHIELEGPKMQRNMHAMRSFVSRPSRHPHLRTLIVALTPKPLHLVEHALQAAHGLCKLSLINLSPADAEMLLCACSSRRVEHLVAAVNFEPLLSAWLADRPTLRMFMHAPAKDSSTTRFGSSELTLPDDALPDLCIVGGRGWLLQHLVPGRPVVFAALDYPMAYNDDKADEYHGAMCALGSSKGPLRALSIQFQRPPAGAWVPAPLAVFLEYRMFELPSVRVLDLFLAHHWVRLEAFYEICQVLHCYPGLRTLRLTIPNTALSSHTHHLQSIVNVWLRHCPTLVHVVLREHLDEDDVGEEGEDEAEIGRVYRRDTTQEGGAGTDRGVLVHQEVLRQPVYQQYHHCRCCDIRGGGPYCGDEQMWVQDDGLEANTSSCLEMHATSLRQAIG